MVNSTYIYDVFMFLPELILEFYFIFHISVHPIQTAKANQYVTLIVVFLFLIFGTLFAVFWYYSRKSRASFPNYNKKEGDEVRSFHWQGAGYKKGECKIFRAIPIEKFDVWLL